MLVLNAFFIAVSSTNKVLFTYIVWGRRQLLYKKHALSCSGAESKTVTVISTSQGFATLQNASIKMFTLLH